MPWVWCEPLKTFEVEGVGEGEWNENIFPSVPQRMCNIRRFCFIKMRRSHLCISSQNWLRPALTSCRPKAVDSPDSTQQLLDLFWSIEPCSAESCTGHLYQDQLKRPKPPAHAWQHGPPRTVAFPSLLVPKKRDKKSVQKWPMQIPLHLHQTWESSTQVLTAEHQAAHELVQQELWCQNWNPLPSHRQFNKRETEAAKQLLTLVLKETPWRKTYHGDRHHPGVPELFCPCVEWRGACHHLHSTGKAADKSSHLIFQNDYWDIYHAPPFANTMWQKRALHCRLSSDNNAISSTFWDMLCFSRF